jgi:predicted MFS family arabinose efflux permease
MYDVRDRNEKSEPLMTSRWSVLVLLFGARLSIGFQFESVAAAADALSRDFAFSPVELGALIGLYVVPGLVVAIPGGLLTSRVPDNLLSALALALMAAGSLVMAAAASHGWLAVGRLMGGAGFAIVTLVLTKMVTAWFHQREMSAAMGILLASWPCGVALGLLVEPSLVAGAGWPVMMVLVAAVCCALGLIVATLYRAPGDEAPLVPLPRRPRLSRLEAVLATLAGLAWGGVNLGLVVFFSFGPVLLEAHGFAPVRAGLIIGLGLWVTAVSLPLGGMIAERIHRPTLVISISAGLAALPLYLLPLGISPALLSIAFGLALGPLSAAVMALPGTVLSPATRGVGLGLFYAIFFAEVALGPVLAGWAAESGAGPAGALWFGAATFLSSALAAIVLNALRARVRNGLGLAEAC